MFERSIRDDRLEVNDPARQMRKEWCAVPGTTLTIDEVLTMLAATPKRIAALTEGMTSAQLRTAANGETPFDAKPHKLPIAVTQKMLKLIRQVEIKPRKGRSKDFQRLQDLVDDLTKELPAAQ